MSGEKFRNLPKAEQEEIKAVALKAGKVVGEVMNGILENVFLINNNSNSDMPPFVQMMFVRASTAAFATTLKFMSQAEMDRFHSMSDADQAKHGAYHLATLELYKAIGTIMMFVSQEMSRQGEKFLSASKLTFVFSGADDVGEKRIAEILDQYAKNLITSAEAHDLINGMDDSTVLIEMPITASPDGRHSAMDNLDKDKLSEILSRSSGLDLHSIKAAVAEAMGINPENITGIQLDTDDINPYGKSSPTRH